MRRILLPLSTMIMTLSCMSSPASYSQNLPVDKQQAVGELTKQIAAHPDDYQLYAKRGFILYKANLHKQADTDFVKALSLHPTWQMGYLLRAQYNKDEGNFVEAIRCLDKAEKLVPLNSEQLNLRGVVFFRMHSFHDAVTDFTKAIALDPKNNSAFFNRAEVNLSLLGPCKEVEADYAKAAELCPTKLNFEMLRYVKRELKKSAGKSTK